MSVGRLLDAIIATTRYAAKYLDVIYFKTICSITLATLATSRGLPVMMLCSKDV